MNDATILPFERSVGCGMHASALNNGCFCIGLDRSAVRHAFAAQQGVPGLAELVDERCPHLFSAHPVFVEAGHIARMREIVAAVEHVVALPAWQEQVLARSPVAARHETPARSVFFGYDFHVGLDRIGLIEINTNAGGALLNAVLGAAQRGCCAPVEALFPVVEAEAAEQRMLDMFRNEWRLAGRAGALQSVAIVDHDPQNQYLYPEFLLFRELFRRNGITAVVADPARLRFDSGRLCYDDQPIDLVYNRSTDFAFENPASAALRAAWFADAAVITPHPRAHALYADKANLALLSDPQALEHLGVARDVREVLAAGIPRTERVTAEQAESLWARRRDLFFKPRAGFGSKAAYRGDKITRRVWKEICEGDYVAQAIVAPGQRLPARHAEAMKFDLRAYVYDGAVQQLAARLYQGQTTNFRTPGGGFAPVYAVPEAASSACAA